MGYIWNFKEDEDVWLNDEHGTVEECLEEARKEAERDEHQVVVFIGECVPYTPEADCTDILDGMQGQAGDTCGEIGGEWCAYDWHKKNEIEELNDALTAVICDWMKKFGYYPTFYSIENIKKYVL